MRTKKRRGTSPHVPRRCVPIATEATHKASHMIRKLSPGTTPKSGFKPDLQRAARPQRVPVIVVTHPDGYVEVFGPPETSVVCVQVPETRSTAAEILAEQLIESRLPATHRKVFAPGHLRETANVERVTVEQLADRKWLGEFNAAITKLRESA